MTLDDLRADVRAKADEEATSFIDTTQLDRWINQGYYLVFSKIAQRFEDYFITKSSAASTVVDQEEYALPTNMLKLVRVESRPSTSSDVRDWVRVERINILNASRSGTLTTEYLWQNVYRNSGKRYFVAGNNIVFDPIPAEVFSYRFWSVNAPTALSAGSDTPVIPSIYHPCLSEFGAIQCLRKSGEAIYSESMALWNQELQNLLDTVDIRDQQSEQMTVTEGAYDQIIRSLP